MIGLHTEPTGKFAHPPEPLPENLTELCEAVKKHGAHLGIAVDPDVDRCVLIDDTGTPIGEEYPFPSFSLLLLNACIGPGS